MFNNEVKKSYTSHISYNKTIIIKYVFSHKSHKLKHIVFEFKYVHGAKMETSLTISIIVITLRRYRYLAQKSRTNSVMSL